MRKNFFWILMMVAAICSCGGGAKKARNYNNDIIGKETELVPDIRKTEQSVKEFFTNGMYDSVGKAGGRMESIVQQKIDEIKAMPVPKAKGAEKFKDAVLEYFTYIKKTYSKYRELGEASTEEERQAIVNDVKEIYSKRTKVLEDFRNAQRRYADENGFRMEQPKFGE